MGGFPGEVWNISPLTQTGDRTGSPREMGASGKP